MKFGAKKNTDNIQEITSQSKSFEISFLDVLKKSERRAWMVTWGSVALSLLLAGGYVFMIPLKKEVPYLVLADQQTGTSTVARLTEDFSDTTITTSEAVNKSNVAHFVIARESYDWDLIGRRDWNTVYSMAGGKVAAEYKELFSDINSNNPDKIWGQKTSVRIKIKSIVLLDTDNDASTPPTGATVRFERIMIDNQSARASVLDGKVATLAFTYKNNLKMNDESRVENPLGFQVTAYRVDNDLQSNTPVAEPTQTAQPNIVGQSPAITQPPSPPTTTTVNTATGAANGGQ